MKFFGKACLAPAVLLAILAGCGGGSGVSGSAPPPTPASTLIVNSTGDSATPPSGTVTLRSALANAASGQTITFDRSLNGATVSLTTVADEHTLLKGEVMGMRLEPSGPVSYLVGYFDRDYGRSALVARKDVVIDASALPSGVTIAWTGGATPGARVLAVDGNLTLVNVAITGGSSVTEKLTVVNPDDQPWTLARGAALAVWGIAHLSDCRLYGNRAQGDFDSSRDRGAYGGAVYADIVDMKRCIVSGNSVVGGGAAGGGVYSVGGAGHSQTVSTIASSSITGNRKTLRLVNSTIARNVVEPAPGLAGFLLGMGYWRGGGVYMSNGYLEIESCTITPYEV
jgi:hypothetical protein